MINKTKITPEIVSLGSVWTVCFPRQMRKFEGDNYQYIYWSETVWSMDGWVKRVSEH